MSLPSDVVNQQFFRWRSSDPVLGRIETNDVIPSHWTVLGDTPDRLVFTGEMGGATFSANVLLGDYQRATVDVTTA